MWWSLPCALPAKPNCASRFFFITGLKILFPKFIGVSFVVTRVLLLVYFGLTRCIVEAWALLRQHCNKLNTEEVMRFLFETCQELGLMKELLKLPLGLAEQVCASVCCNQYIMARRLCSKNIYLVVALPKFAFASISVSASNLTFTFQWIKLHNYFQYASRAPNWFNDFWRVILYWNLE